MPIQNDGDIIRGLGFVALYAAYLEEQVDNLLFMLQSIEEYTDVEQCWRIDRKIDKARRLLVGIDFEYRDALRSDLGSCKRLFDYRNELLHGRIYAGFEHLDTLKSGRPNTPDRQINAAELYDLANNLAEARAAVYRPTIIQLPNALAVRK